MKNRLTCIDICGIVGELKHTLINMRVKKVYDISSKCYMIKFIEYLF